MATPTSVPWAILAYNPPFLIPTLSLVGALLAGAVIIALVRRRMRLDANRPDAGSELVRYRALYEQGAISEKEYHAVRALLGGELRKSVEGVKASQPAPPPKTNSTSDTRMTTDASTGLDVPNTPVDGIRPAE